jgi:hypothetical protein
MLMMTWQLNDQGRLTGKWDSVLKGFNVSGLQQATRQQGFNLKELSAAKSASKEYYLPDSLVAIV